MRVYAGECTTEFEGARDRVQQGHVVVLVKPDRTVLVHDADGYQPVAWLTRSDEVTVETDGDAFAVTARTDDEELRVVSRVPADRRAYPVSEAGTPVGTCPDCDGTLVRAKGDVTCLGCESRYGLPAGATVLAETCDDCGLPLMAVERGEAFEMCVDYACESLSAAVREAIDGEYDCPDCGSPLRVRSPDGRIFLGCDAYPDCETSFSLPSGVFVGECSCGLPVVETARGRRCLDGTCEEWAARAEP